MRMIPQMAIPKALQLQFYLLFLSKRRGTLCKYLLHVFPLPHLAVTLGLVQTGNVAEASSCY